MKIFLINMCKITQKNGLTNENKFLHEYFNKTNSEIGIFINLL